MKLIVVRLCSDRSLFRPRTLVIRDVEIRNGKTESTREKVALLRSIDECEVTVDERLCPRLATVVDADSFERCSSMAEMRFEETLDLLHRETFGMARLTLLEAGYHRDLCGSDVVPRHPAVTSRLGPTPMFHMVDEEIPQITQVEHLADLGDFDLCSRYMRSLHWSRKAAWEPDIQLRILFRWFAIEAACKVDKDFDVAPVIAAALGFPMKKTWNKLDAFMRNSLKAHSRYEIWRAYVHKTLRDLGRWRNDSVHSGFRPWDIPKPDLETFDRLILLGCARVQSLVCDGLFANLRDAGDFSELLGTLIELRGDGYVKDVHGTIIYTLEG